MIIARPIFVGIPDDLELLEFWITASDTAHPESGGDASAEVIATLPHREMDNMADDPEAKLSVAIPAVMHAIIETCANDEDGGEFDPSLAVAALTSTIALIMESSPAIRTPRDMRQASEHLAKDFRAHLQGWRKMHEATGERAWTLVLAGAEADGLYGEEGSLH